MSGWHPASIRANAFSFNCIFVWLSLSSRSVGKPLTLSSFGSIRFAWTLPPDLYASSLLNNLVPWLNYGFIESACPSCLDPIILLSGCSLTHIIILQGEAYGITVPSITAHSTLHIPWMTDYRYIPDVWPILLEILNLSRQTIQSSHNPVMDVSHSYAS